MSDTRSISSIGKAIVDADAYPLESDNRLEQPLTPQPTAHPLALFAMSIVGLLFLVFLVAGIIVAHNTFLQGASIMIMVLVWITVVGVPLALGIGVLVWYQGHRRKVQIQDIEIERARAAIRREDELYAAKVENLSAQTDVLRRTIPFDAMGNAAVLDGYGQPVQLRGNYSLYPHLQTYHHTRHNDTRIEEEQLAQLGQGAQHLPSIETFYDIIPYNSLQVGMGTQLDTGQPIIAEIRKSTHFKLIGGSGQGKSCVAGAILDIATATNDADHLKIGLLDLEYNTSRLFENVPHIAEIGPRHQRLIGRNPDEVAQKLKLLQWELTRRGELGEKQCTEHEPVLLVYVEEMLALKYEVVDKKLKADMLAAINIVGVRGRKYGIFLLACMQTDYSDKSTREAMAQFRTRAGFAIDPDTARASGFFNTELVKQNFLAARPGQYVLEKPSYTGIALAPNYDVRAKLERLGATTVPASMPAFETFTRPVEIGPVVDTEPLVAGSVAATTPTFTAQEWRILNKYRRGDSMNTIIASEYTNSKGEPLTGGDAYTKKAREIQALIGRFIPQREGA